MIITGCSLENDSTRKRERERRARKMARAVRISEIVFKGGRPLPGA